MLARGTGRSIWAWLRQIETVRRPALPDARRSARRWALSFETWSQLHRLEHLSNEDAVALVLELLVLA